VQDLVARASDEVERIVLAPPADDSAAAGAPPRAQEPSG